MKISTRGRYCTRMVLELALNYGKGPIFLKDIAKKQEISTKYLSQLILPLRAIGLIIGTKSAHGGYMLAKKPKDIRLNEIITAVEGSLNPTECVDNPEICKRSSTCVTIEVWRKMGEKNLEVLRSQTLQDLVDRHNNKIAMLKK